MCLSTSCDNCLCHKTTYMGPIKDFSKGHRKPHELFKTLQSYLGFKGLKSFLEQGKIKVSTQALCSLQMNKVDNLTYQEQHNSVGIATEEVLLLFGKQMVSSFLFLLLE